MVGTFILLIMLLFSIAILVYLVILGNSMTKTDREKQMEDEEQLEYLKNYKKEKQIKKKSKDK